jgi:hypothetical protein
MESCRGIGFKVFLSCVLRHEMRIWRKLVSLWSTYVTDGDLGSGNGPHDNFYIRVYFNMQCFYFLMWTDRLGIITEQKQQQDYLLSSVSSSFSLLIFTRIIWLEFNCTYDVSFWKDLEGLSLDTWQFYRRLFSFCRVCCLTSDFRVRRWILC